MLSSVEHEKSFITLRPDHKCFPLCKYMVITEIGEKMGEQCSLYKFANLLFSRFYVNS